MLLCLCGGYSFSEVCKNIDLIQLRCVGVNAYLEKVPLEMKGGEGKREQEENIW